MMATKFTSNKTGDLYGLTSQVDWPVEEKAEKVPQTMQPQTDLKDKPEDYAMEDGENSSKAGEETTMKKVRDAELAKESKRPLDPNKDFAVGTTRSYKLGHTKCPKCKKTQAKDDPDRCKCTTESKQQEYVVTFVDGTSDRIKAVSSEYAKMVAEESHPESVVASVKVSKGSHVAAESKKVDEDYGNPSVGPMASMYARDKLEGLRNNISRLRSKARRMSHRGGGLESVEAKIKQYEKEIERLMQQEYGGKYTPRMGESFVLENREDPLWLCNECTRTFRNAESKCLYCDASDTDRITPGGEEEEVVEKSMSDEVRQILSQHLTKFIERHERASLSSDEEVGSFSKTLSRVYKVSESDVMDVYKAVKEGLGNAEHTFRTIGKGIEDKREADDMARRTRGAKVVSDDEDEKRFMVIVPEEER